MDSYQFQKAATEDGVNSHDEPNDSSKNRQNSRIVAAFFVVLFVGPAAMLFQQVQSSDDERDAATIPTFGSPNKEPNCYSDMFGKVYSEQALVNSDGAGGMDPFTTILLRGEDGVSGPYYIASTSDSVGIFGGKDYIEYGTVTILPNGEATYGNGKNCQFKWETQGILDGVPLPLDSNVYPSNSWDGGKSWLMAGSQDFGDGVRSLEACIFNSIDGEICKQKARAVYDKLVQNGVDPFPIDVIDSIC